MFAPGGLFGPQKEPVPDFQTISSEIGKIRQELEEFVRDLERRAHNARRKAKLLANGPQTAENIEEGKGLVRKARKLGSSAAVNRKIIDWLEEKQDGLRQSAILDGMYKALHDANERLKPLRMKLTIIKQLREGIDKTMAMQQLALLDFGVSSTPEPDEHEVDEEFAAMRDKAEDHPQRSCPLLARSYAAPSSYGRK
jgi:hypothetical protein